MGPAEHNRERMFLFAVEMNHYGLGGTSAMGATRTQSR